MLVCVTLALAGGGCASSAQPAFTPGREPRMIAVRNMSGRPAQSISIQEDRDPADGPRRMGAVSPVVANHTYAFVRPANAPPLPAKVRVTFSFQGTPPQTTVVDLREVAQQSTGDRNEAVFFELQPNGSVTVSLDHIQPSP